MIYPVDSVIHLLNNCGLLVFQTVHETLSGIYGVDITYVRLRGEQSVPIFSFDVNIHILLEKKNSLKNPPLLQWLL